MYAYITLEDIEEILIADKEFVKWCEQNGFQESDFTLTERFVFIHEAIQNRANELVDDLVALCEDNEVMIKVIKEYFSLRA